jgi:hypothetical protein
MVPFLHPALLRHDAALSHSSNVGPPMMARGPGSRLPEV